MMKHTILIYILLLLLGINTRASDQLVAPRPIIHAEVNSVTFYESSVHVYVTIKNSTSNTIRIAKGGTKTALANIVIRHGNEIIEITPYDPNVVIRIPNPKQYMNIVLATGEETKLSIECYGYRILSPAGSVALKNEGDYVLHGQYPVSDTEFNMFTATIWGCGKTSTIKFPTATTGGRSGQ